MTVNELISQLRNLVAHGLAGDSLVMAYDGDSGRVEPVTGMTYDDESLEFHTDEQ